MLKGDLVKGKIYILNLRLKRTIVWYQSSLNSRRNNSLFILFAISFHFLASVVMLRKMETAYREADDESSLDKPVKAGMAQNKTCRIY